MSWQERGLAALSSVFFRGVESVENWVSLPASISKSLSYRKSWRDYLSAGESRRESKASHLWIHGASLGELEDLAAFFCDEKNLRAAGFESAKLIITSSSPSALPALKKWQQQLAPAYAGPLPPEKSGEIKVFLDHFEIDTFILSQNDFWPQLFLQLKRRAKNFLWLPSDLSREPSLRARSCLPLDKSWVASRQPLVDASLKSWHGFPLEFIGSPRIDRVSARIAKHRLRSADDRGHVLETLGGAPDPQRVSVLVGSAWPEDAALLSAATRELSAEERRRFFFVVIPHETKNVHIGAQIQSLLPEAKLISVEGVLLEAYESFDLAWIGGGLGKGLHNVLEPALWGTPIACGTKLDKQPEAPRLRREGTLATCGDAREAADFLRLLLDQTKRDALKTKARQSAQTLMQEAGASQRLAEHLRKIRARAMKSFEL